MEAKCSPGLRAKSCHPLPSVSRLTQNDPALVLVLDEEVEESTHRSEKDDSVIPRNSLCSETNLVHSILSKHGGSKRSPSPTPTQGPKRQPSGSSAAKRFVHAVPHNARASSRSLSAAAASRRPGAGVPVSIRRDGLRSGGGAEIDSASSRRASRFVASSNARCMAEGCAGLPCHRSPSAIGKSACTLVEMHAITLGEQDLCRATQQMNDG